MEILNVVWTIILVILGISFVIFWHELGHFLAAKWCGVHVKTFSIGFPPTMVRICRIKETDYVLSWIPLGGYVRMLGEEEGEDPEQSKNPAAYHNKPVWQRMIIISAGVVMNVILGFACYVVVFTLGGLPETPPIVGGVAAGGPAYVAGMRQGDEIVAIDDKTNVTFNDLQRVVAHSVDRQIVRFVVQRPGADDLMILPIEPVPDPVLQLPTIRVQNATGLTLNQQQPFLHPAGMEGEPDGPEGGFQGGDTILRVGPVGGELTPVSSHYELTRVLVPHRTEALEFVVSRRDGDRDPALKDLDDSPGSNREVAVTVPPNRFVDFGFRLTAGPVVAMRQNSPAEQAGIQVGDVIAKVEGQGDFDPMRLPELAFERQGEPLEIEVRRVDRETNEAELVSLTITPGNGVPWSGATWNDEPLNVESLGLSFEVLPKIAGIRDDSPAARAGLKPGTVIEAVTLEIPKLGAEEETTESVTLTFGPKASWTPAFDQVQQFPIRPVAFKIANRDDPIELTPEVVDDWYDYRRGLLLDSLTYPMPPLGLADAVRRGGAETVDTITMIYSLIQSLFQQRVGRENIAGPIRIAQAAYQIAGRGVTSFLQFIGFLSINLAVINFLPIPPLDGGQMVFLVGEAVRGRPLPQSCLNLMLNIGILLVLCLMIFVLFQDVFLTLFSR